MPSLHHNHPEAEERTALWSPRFPEKFASMPQTWRELIQEAKAHQIALGVPDNRFVGTLLSGPAWNQLVNGAYPVPSTDRGQSQMVLKLRALVQRGENMLNERQTAQAPAELVLLERPELRRVEQALDEAKRRLACGIEERLVTIVGPTRAGKTCLLRMLKERQRIDWTFRALPSTKVRYRKFLEGMAKAIGLRDLSSKDVTDLEEAVLAKFSSVPCVLAIEELQRFSRRALEFLKCVLNETQASLVLCLKPAEWKAMRRTLNEDMQQFLGRNIATIRLQVTAEMVAEVAKAHWADGADAQLCRQIASEAEKGGGMSAVRVIIESAARLAGSKPVTSSTVNSALRLYRLGVPELTPTAQRLLAA